MALSRKDVIIAGTVAVVSWSIVSSQFTSIRYVPQAFLAGILTALIAAFWIILSTSRGSYNNTHGWVSEGGSVAFTSAERWKGEVASLKSRSQVETESVYPQSPVVSDSIDKLLAFILRDFIHSWYGNISQRPTFPNEVDRAIRAALSSIAERFLKLDVVEITVSRMVPIVTAHLKDFYEAERAVRGRKLTRNITESEELDLAIAGKYRDGSLHPAASLAYSNTKLVQQQHLRSVVTRLIPRVLPRSMTTSPAVNVLIREIVACAVLYPVMQLLSDPDTWNQLMEGYGRSVLQERKTVKRLRAALDEHAPSSPKSTKFAQFPRLAPNDNERKFERFIRAIRQCNTLSDARRFRSEVASQLRREQTVDGQDPLYIRRLETGKKILDQKVAYMTTAGATGSRAQLQVAQKPAQRTSRFEEATLRQLLYDTSGLSCFMEYMDRLQLMRLVQFWIVVDGFRNPLEEDTDEPENSGVSITWTDSERTDIAQINEAYLIKPELNVTDNAKQAVRDFLKVGKDATPTQYLAARRAVLQAQTSIYQTMQENYFRKFKNSDLWYKFLASDEASNASLPPAHSDSYTLERSESSSSSYAKRKIRDSNQSFSQSPELRRAVASSSDLRGFVRPSDSTTPPRRSLDDSATRAPLFDDFNDGDPLARSTQSLESEGESYRNGNDANIVDAMQAALNDILENEPDRDSLFSEPSLKSPLESDSMRGSLELPRPEMPKVRKDKVKPSISSLGLVGAPIRSGVFTEDSLFEEEEKFPEDELEESDAHEKEEEDMIHEAAPGDLGLAEAIESLTADIERLTTQESIIESLMRKAELTNNAAELRILRKSKASLQREVRRKELQRQQYIVQESDNSLYGRASVSIQSIMVGNEGDGREYAMYVVEVRRQAGEQMPAAKWVVARRYSEFHELNKRLRSKYPMVRNIEFPRRQLVLKLQRDFLQKRRLALEHYLQELLLIPAVCRSRELRAFLSQQAIISTDPSDSQPNANDFVTRIYNSVTDGMEEFLGNIPVLDQLSLAGQNLISAAASQLQGNTEPANGVPPSLLAGHEATNDAEAEAEMRAFESRELEPFVKPICDLFLELFELNRESNWLRGRAVVVVLHQLLGGTIERKIRENAKMFTSEDSVIKYIDMVRDIMWPNGQLRSQPPPRTSSEKVRSRKEAGLLLASLVPDIAGSVVGRANAQTASRRILATLNNERLNTHLVFTILDEIVHVVFEGDV